MKADQDVLQDVPVEKWEKTVQSHINQSIRNGKDVKIVAEDGDVLTITEDTAWKMVYRNNVMGENGKYRKMTDEEYAAKLRAASQLDEIAEVSTRGKGLHKDKKIHTFASDGFNYRKAFYEDVDGKYYMLTISVGKNRKVLTIYNIGKMEQKTAPLGIGSLTDKPTLQSRDAHQTRAVYNSIAQTPAQRNPSDKTSQHSLDLLTEVNQGIAAEQKRKAEKVAETMDYGSPKAMKRRAGEESYAQPRQNTQEHMGGLLSHPLVKDYVAGKTVQQMLEVKESRAVFTPTQEISMAAVAEIIRKNEQGLLTDKEAFQELDAVLEEERKNEAVVTEINQKLQKVVKEEISKTMSQNPEYIDTVVPKIDNSIKSDRARQLAKNKIQGREFEKQKFRIFKEKYASAEEQITIVTNGGKRMRVDAIAIDENGNIVIEEYKSSASAPVRTKQEEAFEDLEKMGGVIVGKGKGMFAKGKRREIPPGITVKIIRPD